MATILAIGTALPPDACSQRDFVDSYFSEAEEHSHQAENAKTFSLSLPEGEKSGIKRRHFSVLPRFDPDETSSRSLEKSFAVANERVPELAARAARNALDEWGRPASSITHLV
ncbi:hypothetical protein SELMODRAFT_405294 [Selaginella moellendorffii]|uniref:Chalcone/stilbene synthase N-terminal domain-containing protein n=1 Tax=Selaginella moellendorffii TaxID=88036 RepID=D8QWW4_SELML|nr:hypothetical protein SELMODRAFT_405294 [Selaginella moellendorffii]